MISGDQGALRTAAVRDVQSPNDADPNWERPLQLGGAGSPDPNESETCPRAPASVTANINGARRFLPAAGVMLLNNSHLFAGPPY